MKSTIKFIFFLLLFFSCTTDDVLFDIESDFTIAFGSCNKEQLPNNLWTEIQKDNPNVWIWGGDNIYADTHDMSVMAQKYQNQKNKSDYTIFRNNVEIIGIWDDHDYGVNDAGSGYSKKEESQQLFLDFMDVSSTDPLRNQEGIYTSKSYITDNIEVKIILLDTRYFRTGLTSNPSGGGYIYNTFGEGTILGENQWNWLQQELETSTASFNIIVSSIQFLSKEHGGECWGNFPHEAKKLEDLISSSDAQNVFLLSGDRHYSEVSRKSITNLPYDLVDFTSSGMTHNTKTNAPNSFRVTDRVSMPNYGLVKINFAQNKVVFHIKGSSNRIIESYLQTF